MAAGELRLEQFRHIWNVPETRLDVLKQQQNLVSLDDVVVSESQWQNLKDACLKRSLPRTHRKLWMDSPHCR